MGADARSDNQHLPSTPEEAAALMSHLTVDPPPTPEEEVELLASLPAAAEVMVVRSLRMPIELDEAVTQPPDQPISRADALRALTLLRPVR
jgi:hypothetical protein